MLRIGCGHSWKEKQSDCSKHTLFNRPVAEGDLQPRRRISSKRSIKQLRQTKKKPSPLGICRVSTAASHPAMREGGAYAPEGVLVPRSTRIGVWTGVPRSLFSSPFSSAYRSARIRAATDRASRRTEGSSGASHSRQVRHTSPSCRYRMPRRWALSGVSIICTAGAGSVIGSQ